MRENIFDPKWTESNLPDAIKTIVADLQEAFREVAEYVNDPVSFHEVKQSIITGSTIVLDVGVIPERVRLNFALFCAAAGSTGYFGYSVGWCDIWFADNEITGLKMASNGLYMNYPANYIRSVINTSTVYAMQASTIGDAGGAHIVAIPTWDKINQRLTFTFTATNVATGTINRVGIKVDAYRR